MQGNNAAGGAGLPAGSQAAQSGGLDPVRAKLAANFIPGPSPAGDFLLTGISDPAKIGFDKVHNRILVPQITSNAVLMASLPSGGEVQP